MGDINKTRNLILHICKKLEHTDNFGATLLNKMLYYIDNVHYLKHGEPISHLTYIKQKNGFTPKPSEFLMVRDLLVEHGEAELREVEYFGKIQKRLFALSEPELGDFSPDEIALIDNIVEQLKDMRAVEISELSHSEINWQIAKPMEELPFYTYLLTEEPVTDEDRAWARDIINQKRANVHSNI